MQEEKEILEQSQDGLTPVTGAGAGTTSNSDDVFKMKKIYEIQKKLPDGKTVPIEVFVQSTEDEIKLLDGTAVRWHVKEIYYKFCERVVRRVELAYAKNMPALELTGLTKEEYEYLKMKGVPVRYDNYQTNYITIPESDFKKIKEIKGTIHKENKQAKEQAFASIPLRYVVKSEHFQVLDIDYTAKVFVPNKAETQMTEQEKAWNKRFVESAPLKQIHIGTGIDEKYRDARDYTEGTIFTTEMLESLYSEQLKAYDELQKQEAEEQRKKEEERQKKIEEALKKAKETNEEVVIEKVGIIDADNPSWWEKMVLKDYGLRDYKRGEYGIVVIYLVATPEGKLVERAFPSY